MDLRHAMLRRHIKLKPTPSTKRVQIAQRRVSLPAAVRSPIPHAFNTSFSNDGFVRRRKPSIPRFNSILHRRWLSASNRTPTLYFNKDQKQAFGDETRALKRRRHSSNATKGESSSASHRALPPSDDPVPLAEYEEVGGGYNCRDNQHDGQVYDEIHDNASEEGESDDGTDEDNDDTDSDEDFDDFFTNEDDEEDGDEVVEADNEIVEEDEEDDEEEDAIAEYKDDTEEDDDDTDSDEDDRDILTNENDEEEEEGEEVDAIAEYEDEEDGEEVVEEEEEEVEEVDAFSEYEDEEDGEEVVEEDYEEEDEEEEEEDEVDENDEYGDDKDGADEGDRYDMGDCDYELERPESDYCHHRKAPPMGEKYAYTYP